MYAYSGFRYDKESKVIKPRKVLVLGSGGLSIGQAGEFDYSGSQVELAYYFTYTFVIKVGSD